MKEGTARDDDGKANTKKEERRRGKRKCEKF
jgi:hypothetical protein